MFLTLRFTILLLTSISLWAAGAQRIVSTAPSITETLFAMGLGLRVVGDTIYCNYPPQAAKLPKIGSLLRPDVETIVALHPDLVLVQKQPDDISEQLTRLHIPWLELESKNLDDVYASARAIGKAADVSPAAEHLVHTIQSELAGIRARTVGQRKVSTVFIVAHTAGRLEGLIVGSGKSFFSDLLDVAGGTNIFSDTRIAYPKVSLEEILVRNPDVILELSGDEVPNQAETSALWQSHPSLKAVRNKRIYAMSPGPLVVPGPRAAQAARELLRFLHPEIRP